MGRAPLRRVGTLALLALVSLSSRVASAADPPASLPEIDFTYIAPSRCPKHGELLEELGRRIDPAWHTGADPRRFVLRIEGLANGSFSGRLEVTRAERETEAREFHAETCSAVSSALVVFIAIALDPASTEPEHEPRPPPPARLPATSTGAPPAAPRAARRLSRVRVEPPRQPESAWVWTSSVGWFYLRAPLDAWGPRVDAEIARTKDRSRIAPALRISRGSAGFETRPPDGGTARFRIQAARVSACARLDLAPAPIIVAPCAGFEQGSLVASSRDLPQVGRASSSWSAMAWVARASWRLLPWLAVEGEVGLEVPFSRPTFALREPVRIAYRPSSVLFTAGVGLAVSARFR